MGSHYSHLTLDERRLIFRLWEATADVALIAARLGRHRSTIYREVRRNWYDDAEAPRMSGYFPTVAHDATARRRRHLGKLHRDEALASEVIAKLKLAWSPEQIAGRMRREASPVGTLCHETIYRYVYGPAGRAADLHRLLPSRRRRRRPRYARKPRGLYIPEENTIKKRPEEISQRMSFGHWECDLVGFRKEFGKHKLMTLVERFSRYTYLSLNASRHSVGIISGVGKDLALLPPAGRQSVTFGRGTEFTAYHILKRTLGVESYFCAPQAPGQKGSVENTNGRLRRFLPLDTDIANTTADELSALACQMNATPRRCLGYNTPAEVFEEFVTTARGTNIRSCVVLKLGGVVQAVTLVP
jgi:IS30 family transposase